MVIDDSLSMRMYLCSLFHKTPGFEVIASAENPIIAMEKLKTLTPDVITLDVEMPEMDGLTFLKKLMRLKPLPVVMISTLTSTGTSTAIEALNNGAIDVVGKPSHKASELAESQSDIIEKVRAAAHAKVGQSNVRSLPNAVQQNSNAASTRDYEPVKTIDDLLPLKASIANENSKPLIVIGSSTGGPPALKEIISGLTNPNTPPIVIVQHIGIGFTKSLAKNINNISDLTVTEAQEGEVLKNGHIYIAPSGKHLAIKKNSMGHYICETLDCGRINRHKPSVDVLFRTAQQVCGKKILAIVLTGMGDDGARCLKDLHSIGAETIVQNEESCVVYGMPRMALNLEPKHKSLNLKQITKAIKDYTS